MSEQGANVRFELTIPCLPEMVQVVRSAVSAFASQLNLDWDSIEDLKQAVTEACNNVIEHAYTDPSTGSISVSGWVEGSLLVLQVRDEGVGIAEPLAERLRHELELVVHLDEPPQPKLAMSPLRRRDFGEKLGIGFLIMKCYSHRLEVYSVPNQGTTVRIARELPRG